MAGYGTVDEKDSFYNPEETEKRLIQGNKYVGQGLEPTTGDKISVSSDLSGVPQLSIKGTPGATVKEATGQVPMPDKWKDDPRYATPQTQGQSKEPTINDVWGMVEQKSGIKFGQDPNEIADKKLDAEIAPAFRQLFGRPISEIDKLSKEERKHWDAQLENNKTKFRADAKEKYNNAMNYLKQAATMFDKGQKDEIARLRAGEVARKEAKAESVVKPKYTTPDGKIVSETKQGNLVVDGQPFTGDMKTLQKIGGTSNQGGTAFSELEPPEKENAYKNFILNKITPSFGMGANPDRKAWNAGLNQWMVTNKITPEDVATGRAAVKFQQATGTLQNKAILTTIDPLLDSLTKAGKELGNSSIPGWNYLKNTFKEASGQPEIVAFKNLRDDTIAEVERGLLNTGVLSDTKYIRAAKNVADSQSFPQLQAAVANMRIVINARLGAIEKMSVPPSNLKSGVGITQQANAKGWKLHTDAKGNKAYVSPDGKQFEEVR